MYDKRTKAEMHSVILQDDGTAKLVDQLKLIRMNVQECLSLDATITKQLSVKKSRLRSVSKDIQYPIVSGPVKTQTSEFTSKLMT